MKDNPYQNPTLPQLDEPDPNKDIGLCTEDLVYMEKIKELQDYLDKVSANFLVVNSSVFYSNLFISCLLIAHCLHFWLLLYCSNLFFFFFFQVSFYVHSRSIFFHQPLFILRKNILCIFLYLIILKKTLLSENMAYALTKCGLRFNKA